MERERKRMTRKESRSLTRNRLLDSAAVVFARRGFYGASVDEIAEEAGYSRGAVYSNFSGKEEIFLALVERLLERDNDTVFDVFNSSDEAREYFERSTEEDATWNMLWLEFLLYAAREPGAAEKLAERFRAWHAQFAESLKRWLAERDLEPVLPAEDLAWLLIAVGNGLGMQTLANPEAGRIFAAALERLLSDASGQSPFRGNP